VYQHSSASSIAHVIVIACPEWLASYWGLVPVLLLFWVSVSAVRLGTGSNAAGFHQLRHTRTPTKSWRQSLPAFSMQMAFRCLSIPKSDWVRIGLSRSTSNFAGQSISSFCCRRRRFKAIWCAGKSQSHTSSKKRAKSRFFPFASALKANCPMISAPISI
jgi:hypothetical protein